MPITDWVAARCRLYTASNASEISPTVARARQQSLDPAAYLADNNAYAFFQSLGDLVMTGPTTTNVGDVQIILFR